MADPTSDEIAELILDCVASIPRGRVMSYGDVAEYVGWRGPRFVGRVLAQNGDSVDVPWHRVLRADGGIAPHLFFEQRARLLAEGVTLRGDRVVMNEFRWDGREG